MICHHQYCQVNENGRLTIAANVVDRQEDGRRVGHCLNITLDVDVALATLFQFNDVPLASNAAVDD